MNLIAKSHYMRKEVAENDAGMVIEVEKLEDHLRPLVRNPCLHQNESERHVQRSDHASPWDELEHEQESGYRR